MDPKQIIEMIVSNRKFIRMRSNIALQNLAMLHKSFDTIQDEECRLQLALNDSYAEVIFGSDYAAAIALSLDVLTLYADSAHTQSIAEHEALIGRSYTYLTEYDNGRKYLMMAYAKALQLADTPDVLGLRADILHNLAMNNHHAKYGDDATVEYLRRALQILEPTDFASRKGVCLMGLGNVSSMHDKMEEALGYHKQAMVLFEEVESHTNLFTVYNNIGICYTHLGQFDQAESYITRSLDMRSRLGSYWEIANSYYTLAILYSKKGEHDRAYATMLISRDYAMVSQAVGIQQMILGELEIMATTRGDMAAAEEHRVSLTQTQRVAA